MKSAEMCVGGQTDWMEFRCSDMASESILDQNDSQLTVVGMHERLAFLPIAPYGTTFSFPINSLKNGK